MSAVMPVTISLVMAVVAGAVIWLVWSLFENLAARRRAKAGAIKTTSTNDAAES